MVLGAKASIRMKGWRTPAIRVGKTNGRSGPFPPSPTAGLTLPSGRLSWLSPWSRLGQARKAAVRPVEPRSNELCPEESFSLLRVGPTQNSAEEMGNSQSPPEVQNRSGAESEMHRVGNRPVPASPRLQPPVQFSTRSLEVGLREWSRFNLDATILVST